MAFVFLFGAAVVFSLKYNVPGIALPLIFDPAENVNQMYFSLNFFIPFGISALCLYGCLFLSGFSSRGFCFIIGLSTAVISCYALDDLLTVNFCMYSAYVLVSASAFAPPRNYGATAFALLFLTTFLFFPALLGHVGGLRFSVPQY